LDRVKDAARDWLATAAPTWLHLLKTLMAVASAMGLAMLLQLPQPRVAMTTAVVLMQPLAGMVLAKSVYRLFGTLLGAVAALVLGGVFVQQPEAYMTGLTGWVAVCTALAVRYRHFRWYGFVLAGYTAALIGIPAVNDPNGLLLASLNRAAEVTLGILGSGAVSALVMPLRASTVFAAGLRRRPCARKAVVWRGSTANSSTHARACMRCISCSGVHWRLIARRWSTSSRRILMHSRFSYERMTVLTTKRSSLRP
jgi:uncharacterized membrane protein YccC